MTPKRKTRKWRREPAWQRTTLEHQPARVALLCRQRRGLFEVEIGRDLLERGGFERGQAAVDGCGFDELAHQRAAFVFGQLANRGSGLRPAFEIRDERALVRRKA